MSADTPGDDPDAVAGALVTAPNVALGVITALRDLAAFEALREHVAAPAPTQGATIEPFGVERAYLIRMLHLFSDFYPIKLDYTWLPVPDSEALGMKAWFLAAIDQGIHGTYPDFSYPEEPGGLVQELRRRLARLALNERRQDHQVAENPWPAVWFALTGDHSAQTEAFASVLNDFVIEKANVPLDGQMAALGRSLYTGLVDAAFCAVRDEVEPPRLEPYFHDELPKW